MRATARASVILAVVIGVLVVALTSSASARTFAPRPPGGGMVENPDGTYSLWGEGVDTEPIRTYTAQEAERMATEDEALAVEAGETGQHASEFVHGITPAEQDAADQLTAQIQTGKLFATPGEAQVGEGIIAQAESAGTLARVGSLVPALGSVIAAGGAAYAGIEVGNALDRTLGLPQLCLFSCPEEKSEERPVVPERIKGKWSGDYESEEKPHDCFTGVPKISGLAGDWCVAVISEYASTKESFEAGKWNEGGAYPTGVAGSSHKISTWSGSTGVHPECPERVPLSPANVTYLKLKLKAGGVACEYHEAGTAYEGKLYLDFSKLLDLQMPAKSHPTWNAGHAKAFESTQAKPLPGGTVLTPPKPNEVSPAITKYIIHEREPEFPGIEEEGKEKKIVPNPLWPEIPIPTPGEGAKHYVERMHELGFANVVEHELTDAEANPRVGPEGVAYTTPAEGTRVDPETTVIVEVNPADAPSPVTPPAGGGFGANIPELKLPKLGVLCRNFPFGVPCWLIEEFAAWSGTSSTPSFTIDSFSVHGSTIGPASVSLSPLAPIMTKVRPFMVLFATIGLVLLFYKFAMGGGPPSGGAGDTGSEDQE